MGWMVVCDACYDGEPVCWGMTEQASVDSWDDECEDLEPEFCKDHAMPFGESGRCRACDAEERADALYDEWKDSRI